MILNSTFPDTRLLKWRMDSTSFSPAGEDNLGTDADVLKSRWKEVEIVPLQGRDLNRTDSGCCIPFRKLAAKKENELSLSDYGLGITVRAQWINEKPADNEGKIRHICITMIDEQQPADA